MSRFLVSVTGSSVVRPCALALALAGGVAGPGRAAVDSTAYHTHARLTSELQAIAKAHTALVKLAEIGKSRQGRSVWVVEIAGPDGPPAATRPGVLLVANIEGDGLTGSELALLAIDTLTSGYASSLELKRQLDSTVFYIVPRLNPDAAEDYFAAVKTGRRTTFTPFDGDNDGRVDEDGPEDLNKDGLITMMRVKDAGGPYTPHADDPRVMKRADPQKGEAGGWALYWEGVDDDGDGFYNEDGVGGTDLDRNFQHQYPYYTPDAGRHMVSEPETRALLDFAVKHRNIAAVLTFGASDNLVATSGGRGTTLDMAAFANEATTAARGAGLVRDAAPTPFFGGGAIDGTEFAPPARPAVPPRPPAPRPATTIHAADQEVFRRAGEKYRELTGIRQVTASRKAAGALFEWAYFQFGVPAFSTPGWGAKAAPPRAEGAPRGEAPTGGQAASAAATTGSGASSGPGPGPTPGPASVSPPVAAPGPSGPGAGAGSGPGSGLGTGAAGRGGDGASTGEAIDDVALLKWLDAEKVEGFAAWTTFQHPALGAVEIGGFRPYATTAPVARLAELGQTHTAFLVHLSTQVPRIAIVDATVTSHGGGLYRIKAQVENRGVWPTALQHAVNARAVKPVLVQLNVEPDAIVSGHPKTNLLPTLAGSGRRERYEWIVRGKAGQQVTLKAVAEKGGTATASLTLK